MYIARRCPPLYYFHYEPGGVPSERVLASYRPSVIEALEVMGVWLPPLGG